MLSGLSNKSMRLLSLVQPARSLLTSNSYSTSAELRVPKNVEYIPGVQGYAPGFGPPSLKPKKVKKITKAKLFARKNSVFNNENREEASGSAKTTAPQSNDLKEKAVAKTSDSSLSTEIHAPKVSVAFIQREINPLNVSYAKKMSLVRQRYRMEMQALEQKRKEDARIEMEAKKAEEDLEKQKQEKLAQELIDRRMQDQLSFDKVLVDSDPTEAEPSTNPFTDPVRKAARLAAKKENFDKAVASKQHDCKTALLTLYYKAADYITPENIDGKLDEFLSKTDRAFSTTSATSNLDIFTIDTKNQGFNNSQRMNVLKDILNDTIDGQPNVDKIMNYKSNNTLVSGYISDLISNSPAESAPKDKQ